MTIKVELQKIGILGLQLVWIFLHFIVSSFYFVVDIATTLESHLISCGFLRKYNRLDIDRVQYLAIVVESDEAYNTLKIIELLQWLESMGIRSVCLYDAEGVLKQSKEIILKKVKNASVFQVTDEPLQLNCKGFTLEFISVSDGKEAIARAASFHLENKWRKTTLSGDHNQCFSESQMTEALKAVGCGGPDPDLILVYGPSRCHLGFPAWRIRYTEILHMGPLKSMKYGSLVKAIYKFTIVRQNYEVLVYDGEFNDSGFVISDSKIFSSLYGYPSVEVGNPSFSGLQWSFHVEGLKARGDAYKHPFDKHSDFSLLSS